MKNYLYSKKQKLKEDLVIPLHKNRVQKKNQSHPLSQPPKQHNVQVINVYNIVVSNSARDWLNLPKRNNSSFFWRLGQFANPEPDTKPKRVVSKPLPSADEVNGVEEKKSVKEVTKSKSNENVRKVFTE